MTLALTNLLLLTACAPSAFDIAMGAGVTLAARADERSSPLDRTADQRLELMITREWMNANKLKFSGLNVISNNGSIRLDGNIKTTDDYLSALKIVWAQKGVRSVKNKIDISKDNRNQKKIEQIIKRLESDKSINLYSLNIEVINDEVFLLGNLKDQMHLSRITHHVNSVIQARRIVTVINYKN